MDELHTGSKHPLSGAESYFDLHVVTMYTSQKERVTAGTWRSITRFTQGGLGSLALAGCPSWREELQ